MGEADNGTQRVKKMAAAAYDYESDPRWAEYWSNILIPPHMASRSDVVDHFKQKFYQRFIDPDFVVEAMSSTSASSQPARPSGRSSSSTSSSSATENARPRSSGSGTTTSAPPGRNANSLQMDRRSIHFSVNAWVLVVAVLGILPIVPRHLSIKAYRLSLLGTTCSSFYSLYTLYGKPRAWNPPAIQAWFQTVIATKDFIHLIYCLMFVASQLHFKFALIPVLCWAFEHVAKFLRHNFAHSSLYRKYLEEPCLWVEANITTLCILSSNTEISLGFLLIISLFSWQRSIIQTFMYWQLLKLMYHAPVTAGYHQSVWARIGRTVNPYIYRYAPFLNSPISAVQRWWFR
ncbi:transmembrane protein 33 homolog [Phoenix dactylifera]|uniref:Transmembrane protein 33 homolog n=1 Tax=Phoenix dactylifera TaxID=42345 RepID=A0A8B7CM02_PHODC|nr:transmembrane protein 33 homolog [Phoenix dactylifera]